MRTLLYAAIALALAAPAGAAEWNSLDDGGGQEVSRLHPGSRKIAYFVFDSNDSMPISNTLDTGACGRLDLTVFRDTSATGGTAEVKVYESLDAADTSNSSVSTLVQICTDTSGDGLENCSNTLDGESQNRKAMRDFMADGVVIEVTSDASSNDTPAVKVQCR